MVDRRGDPVLSRQLDDLVRALDIEVVPFDATQAVLARSAYRDFGKGTRHPAQLNLEDCFAHALARQSGEPLLHKGDDVGHTDVVAAQCD